MVVGLLGCRNHYLFYALANIFYYNSYTKVSHEYREYEQVFTQMLYILLYSHIHFIAAIDWQYTCSTISLWAILRVNILMLYVIYIHSLQLTFFFFILFPPIRCSMFNDRHQEYLMHRFQYFVAIFWYWQQLTQKS